ncbi:hypothetical protein DFQ09_103163 [Winogradskyella pacifica]|uniref:Uncharacterized protein n=1 Tax=Winogradskyella pacifica TaxID=664642 RepID=A0A3D9MZT0_9FLAO|nr:hypothetical protein [Winogradskyella pacifica]REE24857.1 hypothetical protein DFQ09_103163 [Winogradskyella pacifica]
MGINEILEKYNLIKTFETELNVEKEVFINEFELMTEKGYCSPILGIFDVFSSRTKKYIGDINKNKFQIRERYDFESFGGINTSKIKAEYKSEKNILKVKTEILGMEIIPFLIIGMLFIIYALLMFVAILEMLLMLFSSDAKYIDSSMLLGPIILTVFAYFLTYLPYRIGKKNVAEMKNNIEIIYQLIEKTPYNTV